MRVPAPYMILLALIFTTACRLNRTDKHYRKQGRWKIYYDDEKKHLLYKGRYKDGRQVGRSRYHLPEGPVYLREHYKKKSWVKTCYYYPNGHKQAEGYAQLFTGDTTFYRWEGDWIKYDSSGTVISIDHYKLGKFAWKKPLPGKKP